jgi:hypothetical protein
MKYIITESKLNNFIERFIRESFPIVYDVSFREKKVALGSTEGVPTMVQTEINIILNNSENKLNHYELLEMSRGIRDKVSLAFNLDYTKYGSKWDFHVSQIANVPLNATIKLR